jgi:hypothetical protein
MCTLSLTLPVNSQDSLDGFWNINMEVVNAMASEPCEFG